MNALGRALLQRPWLALVTALVIQSVVFFVGDVDFVASDPLWYADIAHRIATDPAAVFASHDTEPFVMRIGLTVPMALLYRVFGVSPTVSNLPCLFAALAVLGVVYGAAPTPRAKWLGMGFGVLCVPLMRHMAVLNIDLPSSALMACSILCLSRRDRPRGAWWLAAAMAAWVAAFLVKETAVWCGVVWLYAAACDLRGSGAAPTARRFAPALGVGVVLGVGYLALCAWLWGDPLARFRGIERLTYDHAWTLHGRGAGAWLQRLTWQPPLLIAKMFRATLVPAVLAGFWVRGPARIWWVSTAAFALLYWFGSTSLFAYSPLPISQRMVLPILPGVLVLATLAADHAIDRAAGSRAWAAGVAVVALAVVVPGAIAIRAGLIRPTPETEAFAALRRELVAPARRIVLVCGEPRCAAVSNIHFGFAVPANLSVVFAGDFARAPRPEQVTVRALVDLERGAGARTVDAKLDLTVPIAALGLPQLAGNADVRLLDAGDGQRLWDALRAALPPGA